LNDNLKSRLLEVPHVAPFLTELEAQIEEAKRLEAEQEVHKARLRLTNQKRNAVGLRGQELKVRIAEALRSHFGNKSNELLQFGVKPRGGARRKKPEEPPKTGSPPAST